LDKRILALGIVLIIIALILGAIQVGAHVFSIYGSSTTKYAYYGLVGLIGLIGIILVAWSYMMKPKPKTQTPAQTQTQKQ